MYVEVLVEIKAKQVDKTFTYSVPKEHQENVQIGIRVLVPFGKKQLEGFVLKIDFDKRDYPVKDILSLIDKEPVLNEEMLELGVFLKKKTFSTLISCYQSMLPTALKAKNNTTVSKKYNTYVILKKELENPTPKQLQLINALKEKGKLLKKEAKEISLYAYKTLIDLNIIEEQNEEYYRLDEGNIKMDKKVVLNNEQQKAVNEVISNLHTFTPYLLFGVTGSGKTEVYMHILQNVLQEKKEAIVLVPEISLTPQFVSVFKARFKNKIAILHSALSDGEKYDEWRKITRKEVSIVIGARSAIFAPFTNLGCIIIDEEHSSTYKQENTPRYNAIDIALYRAKKYNIPIILGSATPSIENYTKAKLGKYQLLTLKKRVNENMPQVILIDMKESIKQGNRLFSNELHDKINNRLENKEQVILLLNRRGYSTIISCNECGYTEKCPYCDIPLTYHKTSNTERCHYCGYGKGKLIVCPECGSKEINQFGLGTQRLEEELNKMFPSAKIVRMDVDTTSKKGTHQKIIEDFGNGNYDILVGTQMIAKGLDFPNVTLVGVLNGDTTLNIPDFRSGERTYQLLSQVAGRSGRGEKKGEVVIQAFNVDHYSIETVKHHDFEKFYEEEINIRKKLSYPPYCYLSLIKLQGKDEKKVDEISIQIRRYLEHNTSHVLILGPSNPTVFKINNIYFKQIILKYKKLEDLFNCLEEIYEQYKLNKDVFVEIDLNPIKM